MAKIKIVPSMALDAICFIDQYNCLDADSNLLEEQMDFIEIVDAFSSGKLRNGSLSMSSLCSIITAYKENDEFENYTLDDLSSLFKNPEDMRDVVKSRITNEFQASHIYPILDDITSEWAEKYIYYIDILKEIEFDKLWTSELRPVVQEEIEKKEEIYKRLDVGGVLTDIRKLKWCEYSDSIKIYMSFMSFPVAFKLQGNNFLDCIRSSRGAGIICHELMHGFSDKELENLYLTYVNSIKYLSEQHDKLINKYHSGNEEEFVMGAEYYLRLKYNGEDERDLLVEARNQYGGCMPVSVFLFALLKKEAETPDGYAQWLADIFRNKKLPKKAILRNLDALCPRNPYDIFNEKLFAGFNAMINKIKEIQAKSTNLDIEKQTEKILQQKFEDITADIGKSVFFAQERQPLPNALSVKESCFENLYINIAEYKTRKMALCDELIDDGGNIGPECEKIDSRMRPLYNVNISC
jgi:hypothetical protein